ncbi:MAG TPA: hypothetical protein VF467_04960 [Afipia sp.]
MSRMVLKTLASGMMGAAAVTLALGAVHLERAAGNDLGGAMQRGGASAGLARATTDSPVYDINRSAKADRDTTVARTGGATLSFKMPGVPDASVAVRVPAGGAADALRKSPAPAGAGKNSAAEPRTIACEPVVSVLTAVAKAARAGPLCDVSAFTAFAIGCLFVLI